MAALQSGKKWVHCHLPLCMPIKGASQNKPARTPGAISRNSGRLKRKNCFFVSRKPIWQEKVKFNLSRCSKK